VSTISDEVRRNQVRGKYDAKKAQHKAYVRRKYARHQGMKIVGNSALQDFVEEHLYDDQSPVAIAKRVQRKAKHLPAVSKNSIYRYIASPYGRRIEIARKKKRHKHRRRVPHLKLQGTRKSIDERPAAINARSRTGDSEMDFIVSGKSGHGILFVVVDRKHRTTFVEQILKPTTIAVERAALKIQKRYPEWQTSTTDNDILFQHHAELEQKLQITIYFCHAYHSWEKGTVENANKIIRRDIPKSSDISKYSKQFIRRLEEKLNRRFMDVLGSSTPMESLRRYRQRKKRQKRS
jgi:IS30 family transposase